MSKNPVIPFILIFALGIGLIFFMSLYGLDQQKEIAGPDEDGTTEEVSAEFDAEAVAQQKCISCHGGDLSGGAIGPSLHGLSLSQEDVHDIIKNGKGTMPNFADLGDENIDVLAEYILSLK